MNLQHDAMTVHTQNMISHTQAMKSFFKIWHLFSGNETSASKNEGSQLKTFSINLNDSWYPQASTSEHQAMISERQAMTSYYHAIASEIRD